MITIIICTYNRDFLLSHCIDSFMQQTVSLSQFKIIVVDNNSKDKTPEIVSEYMEKDVSIQYLFEKKTGLSHARNLGWKSANTEWIAYIDDDAKAASNYVERALQTINQYDFDAFGGMYYGWFKYGRPRWMDLQYGTKQISQKEVGILDDDFFSGGNFVIKRRVLEQLDGFSTDLGMIKERIGYGEEDDLQKRMRNNGFKIGFDPELVIDHAVLKHKLTLGWQLNSYFASSRDQQKIKKDSLIKIVFWLLRSLLSVLVRKLPTSIIKLFFDSEYYWENLILDIGMPISYRLGQVYGYFSSGD